MRVPGIPYDQGDHPKGTMRPVAITLHRTYGSWAGDYSVGKHGNPKEDVGFQLLIGKAEGKWVQFYDSTTVCWHAGSRWGNWNTIGVEFEGTNDQRLTDWQVKAGAWCIKALSDAHGIPLDFLSPSGGRQVWNGVLSHVNIPGANHSDFVSAGDWDRMRDLWEHPAPTVPPVVTPPVEPPKPVDPNEFRVAVAKDLLDNNVGNLPLLQRGDVNLAVAQLQTALNIASGAGLLIDGEFGVSTENAVANFQRFFQLSDDGVFGNQTKFILVLVLKKIAAGEA